MARRRFVAGWVLLAVLGSPVAAADKPFRYPEGKHGKGELKYVNGIPVLTVEGTPEEIGEAIGKLALSNAKRMEELFLSFLKKAGAEKLLPLLAKGCEGLAAKMPEDYQRELNAMIKASGIRRELAL